MSNTLDTRWTTLKYGGLPTPKLIYMERAMVALLVLVSSCKPGLERLQASTVDACPDMFQRNKGTKRL